MPHGRVFLRLRLLHCKLRRLILAPAAHATVHAHFTATKAATIHSTVHSTAHAATAITAVHARFIVRAVVAVVFTAKTWAGLLLLLLRFVLRRITRLRPARLRQAWLLLRRKSWLLRLVCLLLRLALLRLSRLLGRLRLHRLWPVLWALRLHRALHGTLWLTALHRPLLLRLSLLGIKRLGRVVRPGSGYLGALSLLALKSFMRRHAAIIASRIGL